MVGLVVAGLAGCAPGQVGIRADPSLYPTFQTSVVDYVNRCDPSRPTSVDVAVPSGTTVSVDGAAPRGGSFTARVAQQVGRRFTIAVTTDGTTTTHHVRCLPTDFPAWTAERKGTPQAAFYVTSPWDGFGSPSYPVIYDTNGVPVWWGPKTTRFFATLLPNGNMAWNVGDVIEEHRLDGSLVRSYATVGAPLDFHDLILLPNGNHVVVSLSERSDGDFSSWGGPARAPFVDHVIQEISPQGDVVWSWTTSEHIAIAETPGSWRAQELRDPGGGFGSNYDPFHYNSIEDTGDGFIVSFRHLDAVYKIDKATKDIVWKLGGTPRNESLTVRNDPAFERAGGGGFGGQHDARLLSDDTVTLYDNGTLRNRPPRSVAYQLDLDDRTATRVEDVRDPQVASSGCCGSTRVLPDGNYVTAWGINSSGAPDITESTDTDDPRFRLWFPDHNVYRGVPVTSSELSRADLRAGMDAQLGP
ncbi:MAG TPA: aryl-sulfate sulfotransferase [Iamia sp.]|nr:aryl-sulfate sulfotransferase [Iamia sp.]